MTDVRGDCPSCGAGLEPYLERWLRRCRSCGLRASSLEPRVAETEGSSLDEDARVRGLRPVREAGFAAVLDLLATVRPAPGRLLDVGCGHGWFLASAAERGYEGEGVEPDPRVAEFAGRGGARVRRGFFPDVLAPAERFDVVAFNDVLEHMPDPVATLRDAAAHLAPGGVVSVNIPNSLGLFHRLSEAAAVVGWKGPLDRIWQKGLPSPHLYCVSPPVLGRLAAAAGLEAVAVRPIASLRLRGLWSRIRADRSAHPAQSAIWYAGAVALAPVAAAFPPDAFVAVFRPVGAAGPGA